MTIFYKLFFLFLALITPHLHNAHAAVIEVTLHDIQIQQFLAQKGCNFNKEYLDLVCKTYNSKEGQTVLILKIKEIFKKNEQNYSVNFPQSGEELKDILYNKLGIPELTDHESNNKNEKYFNDQLIINTAYSNSFGCAQINTGFNLSTLNLKVFRKAICKAICSYLFAPRHFGQKYIRLYIKVFIDTQLNNVTVLAAPQQSHEGFTCAYTAENIENWFVANAEIQKFGEEVQAYVSNNIHPVSIQFNQNLLHPTSSL